MRKGLVFLIILLMAGCSTPSDSPIQDQPSDQAEEVIDENDSQDPIVDNQEATEPDIKEDSDTVPIEPDEIHEDNNLDEEVNEDSTLDEEVEQETEQDTEQTPEITTPLSDLSRLKPLDFCRLRQTKIHDGDPPQSKGFPLRYNVVPTKGVVNVAFVAIDFPDVKGEEAMIEQWLNEIYTLEAWSQFVAGDAMEYRVHFEPKWITAPKEAKWYGCEGCMRVIMGTYEEGVTFRLQSEMEAIDQVFTAADDYYDWSIMDFAMIMVPTLAEAAPHYVRFYSHGGDNYTPKAGQVFVPVFGGFVGWMNPSYTEYTMWDFAAHEVLHEQGLMGHGPYNGSYYSVMQDQHGLSKMVLSWEAFLLDWWGDDHLACLGVEDLEEESFTFEIESLDRHGIEVKGHRNLMVRLNEEEVIVIEYRTDGPYSDLPEEFQGITAYHINVNSPQFRCDQGCEDLTIEEYDERNFWRYIRDPQTEHPCVEGEYHPIYGNKNGRFCNQSSFVHKPGVTLTWEDIRITVLENNIVEVKRVNSEE